MFMRQAKGKKNELFDLLYRSKWTKESINGGDQNFEQFSYKHTKTSIQITLSKINLLMFMGALKG